jgi:hypothetical protein
MCLGPWPQARRPHAGIIPGGKFFVGELAGHVGGMDNLFVGYYLALNAFYHQEPDGLKRISFGQSERAAYPM